MAPTIVLKDVSFAYPGAQVFSSLDLTVTGGQWTALLGPSGCGKSTLLRMISGSLREGCSGTIRFDGTGNDRGLCAWMAQQDLLFPWLTVLENVLLGARLRGDVDGETRERALCLLGAVGLDGCGAKFPATLSGGMRQRVALLRTLMEKRPVILMDEPFSALDALTRLKLQNLAADLVEGATVLLVTHDPLEALRLGHRIVVMTGRPARIGGEIVPPGYPPRKVDAPEIAALHAELLDRLTGDAEP